MSLVNRSHNTSIADVEKLDSSIQRANFSWFAVSWRQINKHCSRSSGRRVQNFAADRHLSDPNHHQPDMHWMLNESVLKTDRTDGDCRGARMWSRARSTVRLEAKNGNSVNFLHHCRRTHTWLSYLSLFIYLFIAVTVTQNRAYCNLCKLCLRLLGTLLY